MDIIDYLDFTSTEHIKQVRYLLDNGVWDIKFYETCLYNLDFNPNWYTTILYRLARLYLCEHS
jgi:hypothetical protein